MTPEQILEKQFSPLFLQYMKNRLIQGYHKYGSICDHHQEYDIMACIRKRLTSYEMTGNTEFLVYAANFLMFEFMFSQHPEGHFRATSTEESPGIVRLPL